MVEGLDSGKPHLPVRAGAGDRIERSSDSWYHVQLSPREPALQHLVRKMEVVTPNGGPCAPAGDPAHTPILARLGELRSDGTKPVSSAAGHRNNFLHQKRESSAEEQF